MSETWKLEHPIDTEDGKEVAKFTLKRPNLKHAQQLVLLIGGDTVSEIISLARSNGSKTGIEAARNAADHPAIAIIVKRILSPDTFEDFNKLVADYLGTTVETVEKLDPMDLVNGVKQLGNFYPGAVKALVEMAKNSDGSS
jgi:hypothetical protein